MQTKTVSTLSLIQSAYPGKLSFTSAEVSTIIGITQKSIRTLRCRGKLNLPSSGGRHRFDIRDIAEFLDNRRKPKPCRGAPTKAQRVAKAAAQNSIAK